MIYAGLLAFAIQNGSNLALGKPVEVSPRPNYLKDAASQSLSSLTDGKFAAGRLWTDRGTLGWTKVSPVTITIDLGRSTIVDTVSFSTAAGRAGVEVPRSILVLTSDDKRKWRYAGDLVRAAGEDAGNPTEYTLLRISAKDLGAKGRYVRLIVTPQGLMAFCDEIEIYGGGTPVAQADVGADLDAFRRRMLIAGGLARRREFAAFALSNELGRASIASTTRSALNARLPNHRRTFRKPSPATSTNYRFPDAEDSALGSSFATLRRARGFAPVVAWRKHRFDPVEAHEAPPTLKPSASVAIEALRGETRSDALLLTSNLTKPTDVTLTLPGVGLTGLTVAASPWTDTVEGKLVASALPLVAVGKGYRFRLCPGVTTKLWFRLNTANRPAGQTQGRVQLAWAGGKLSVPMRVRVSPVRIGKPRLSIGLFDYLNGNGAYELTGPLIAPAIAAMKAHAVDSPWATSRVLPGPDGNDTANLTAWVRRWPNVRRYMVFANVKDTFGGTRIGTRDFDAKVGKWAQKLAAHMRSLKVKPKALTLLLIDEPNSDEQARIISAWAKAIRKATSEIALMEDPEWADESKPGPREALASMDVVSQFVNRLLEDPSRARLEPGQTLWLYQAQGGAKGLDPSQYYRLQSWFALRHNARGIAFWSLADDGGAPSSFLELAGRRPSASPAFLDRTRIVDSVHWQAMLEGAQDYELFMTLRASNKPGAEALIREATDAVLRDYRLNNWGWTGDRQRATADTYRLKAMRLLEK